MNAELQERVLTIERTVFDPLCPQLFNQNTTAILAAVLPRCQFVDRASAEQDFTRKQVIPYVIVQHGGNFLLMRRTKKQTETRLHDKRSLGIGGHINDADLAQGAQNVLLAGMRRELNEEVQVPDEISCELIGVINDDSTEVARVHLGLVFLLRTASPRFTIM